MTYLICYDISDDKLRTRLSKRLERAGCVRLQKSVFIAPDFDVKRAAILRGSITRLSPPQMSWEESVLMIPIEKDNLGSITLLGNAARIDDLMKKHLFKLI